MKISNIIAAKADYECLQGDTFDAEVFFLDGENIVVDMTANDFEMTVEDTVGVVLTMVQGVDFTVDAEGLKYKKIISIPKGVYSHRLKCTFADATVKTITKGDFIVL